MPDLLDRIYCSEQIHIPPTFPFIMKLYCKAAIRTQPYDLLRWSAAYFRALANGEEPPVKERVEYPPYDSPSGLTPGYIKILINQFGKNPETGITAQTLFKKWSDICLEETLLIKLIALLGATTTVNWVKFVGVCAGFISKTLTQTMILICELFTEEPEGGMATIPYDLFVDLYIFLAQMNCAPLTEQEKLELEGLITEEDVCDVADKIKQGLYGAEEEGELEYERMGEEMEGESEGVMRGEAEENPEEEEVQEEEFEPAAPAAEEKAEGLQEDQVKEDVEPPREPEPVEKEEEDEKQDEDQGQLSDKSSLKEGDSVPSAVSVQGEAPATATEEEPPAATPRPPAPPTEEPEEPDQEEKPAAKPQRIRLEDLEDSVRMKIEAKLEEEESLLGEEGEDKEFMDLNSYILGAATRVQKFTAETIGYRIFKQYLRQEVPGIGAYVDSEQVEKVVDFMDYWSHKQELLVMPRNIRHWMCPPLDPIPTPQP